MIHIKITIGKIIPIHNTIILVCSVIKFLDRNRKNLNLFRFYFVPSLSEKKYDLKKREPRETEKIQVQKLYSTSCQNTYF